MGPVGALPVLCGPLGVVLRIMRLSPSERAAVELAARRFRPAGSRVLLFGSRNDDRRRGGDIDLLVEIPTLCSAADTVMHRNRFTAHLYRLLGERRIDVLVAGPAEQDARSIVESARQQAVPLVQV